MKRFLISVCTGALCLSTSTFAANPNYRAKVMAFFQPDIADAQSSGSKPKISIELVDLNGDGIPEAIVDTNFSCGAHGCYAYVLDLKGPKARSIGEYIGVAEIKELPTKTGSWHDISVNGYKQVYRAGQYRH